MSCSSAAKISIPPRLVSTSGITHIITYTLPLLAPTPSLYLTFPPPLSLPSSTRHSDRSDVDEVVPLPRHLVLPILPV